MGENAWGKSGTFVNECYFLVLILQAMMKVICNAMSRMMQNCLEEELEYSFFMLIVDAVLVRNNLSLFTDTTC